MSQYKKTATELELLVAKFDTLQASPNADNVAQGTAIEEVHQALQAMEPTVQKMAASGQVDVMLFSRAILAVLVLLVCNFVSPPLCLCQKEILLINLEFCFSRVFLLLLGG